MSETNPYAPPEASVADVVSTVESPPLWNPAAAGGWSLLFTPVFGALVHMKNWQALGEPARAENSKKWAIGSVAYIVVMVLLTLVVPDLKALDGLSRIGGLALLIGWYYASGKSQQGYVLARFGNTYKRKGWGLPLLCGLAGIAAFMAVMVVVGIVMAMAQG